VGGVAAKAVVQTWQMRALDTDDPCGVGTNNDKTGYALTVAYDPAKTAMQAGATVTVATNNDKTGYSLTSAYDPAKTAAQVGSAMTLTAGAIDSIWAKTS
jgi:plastocyanin